MWMSSFYSGGRLACWNMYDVDYMFAQPFVASLHLCTAVCCFIVSFVLGYGQEVTLALVGTHGEALAATKMVIRGESPCSGP